MVQLSLQPLRRIRQPLQLKRMIGNGGALFVKQEKWGEKI